MTSLEQIEKDMVALFPKGDPRYHANETLARRNAIGECLTIVRAAMIEERRKVESVQKETVQPFKSHPRKKARLANRKPQRRKE
jgi:hypothetical protein